MVKTDKEKIIESLKKSKGELTSTDLSLITGIHFYKILPALFDLERLKQIEKTEKGRYMYWRIAE